MRALKDGLTPAVQQLVESLHSLGVPTLLGTILLALVIQISQTETLG